MIFEPSIDYKLINQKMDFLLNFNYQTVIFKMGNNPTLPQSVNEHQDSVIIDHPHLGLIQTTNNPKYSGYFLKIYHFADEMMGQQKLRRFNARMKKFTNTQYILSIKSAEMVPKHEMCAHNCDVNLYFEKYEHNLKSILASRLKEKKIFQEQQIYQFINQVLEALIFLQDNGFKNCQLDKQSIVFCQGKIKLVDMGIATSNPFQLFLEKLQPIEGFYVAPEHFKDLKEKNYEPYMSPKSDVFCLGMIILQLACMEPLDNYYNFQKYTIDYESLIHRVSKIVYSVELKTLIAGMLQYQSELRLGLISAQQKVRKALHLDTLQQQLSTTKRSRSSSTKMLKQLLVNSRKTLTVSHKQSDKKSLNKKPSNSSLTSITSLNSRNSVNVLEYRQKEKNIHQRKRSDMYPSKQQTTFLKDLVRNKTQISRAIEKVPEQNKQNSNNIINKELKIQIRAPLPQTSNMKLIQQARSQTFASNTFAGTSYSYQHERRFDLNTPKVNEYLSRINKLKKQQSIFKLILEQSDCGSNKTAKNQNCNTTSNAPDCSPVPPVIPKVTQTNSIKRATPIQQTIRQVAEFDEQINEPKQVPKKIIIQQYPQQSLSLRVKKSLDKMYKTTQSITNSEEKQLSGIIQKSTYKKVLLPNNYSYQGQVRQDEIFQGNGVLYNSRGQIVYSGSWVNGIYEGFGTLYNCQQLMNTKIDLKNLENCRNWIKYQGQFVKGERQGFGTIYYASGERFAGCMRNGQINGYGCFYNNYNEMTSGIWVNNKLQN